eukprot:2744967-Rhodomonas_salina.4
MGGVVQDSGSRVDADGTTMMMTMMVTMTTTTMMMMMLVTDDAIRVENGCCEDGRNADVLRMVVFVERMQGRGAGDQGVHNPSVRHTPAHHQPRQNQERKHRTVDVPRHRRSRPSQVPCGPSRWYC